MTTRPFPALAVVVCLLLGGCIRPAPTDPAAAAAVGTSHRALTVDGRERTYLLYRPASLPRTDPAPLVVVLHGAGGTAEQAQHTYGWNARADEGGFAVAYPDGLHRAWAVSDGCCGRPAREKIDDVGFVEQLVRATAQAVPIDPARVYATGISNGAMLAYRLACETQTFAAIGPVAGTMLNPCPDPAPVSLIHIHGRADRTVPYGGGPGRRSNDGTGPLPADVDGPAVPDLVAGWRAVGDCPTPAETRNAAVTTSTASCPSGRAVHLITIEGAGHQWPGAAARPAAERLLGLDPPSDALPATQTIWRFFAAHPRAPGNVVRGP